MSPLTFHGHARGQREAGDSAPRVTDSHVEHNEPGQWHSLLAGGGIGSLIDQVGQLQTDSNTEDCRIWAFYLFLIFWRLEFKFVAAQLPNLPYILSRLWKRDFWFNFFKWIIVEGFFLLVDFSSLKRVRKKVVLFAFDCFFGFQLKSDVERHSFTGEV